MSDSIAAYGRPSIGDLLCPKSVAIVGLSARPETYGHRVLENLRRGGFRGAVVGVHPRGEPIEDVTVYRTVGDLPAPPTVGVVCTPSETVNPILEDLGRIGCRAAVVLGSGFDETEQGARLAAGMRAVCQRHAMQLVGPNCLGVISLVHDAWMFGGSPPGHLSLGRVAVVSQSGSGIIMMAGCGRLGFSHLISSGNETVSDLAEYLDYLAGDPATRVIGAVIEGISDAGRLLAAARKALANGKPIVALKIGRTRQGAERVRSHTGALAGDPEVYAAFCRRAGIVSVRDYDELIESLVALSAGDLALPGQRVAFAGLSGGEAALIADLSESAGVELAALAGATRLRLGDFLPGFAVAANPLDGTGALVRDPARFRGAITTLGRDPGVDLVVVFLDACPFLGDEQAVIYARLLAVLPGVQREVRKPIIVLSNYSGGLHPVVARALDGSSVPIVHGTAAGLAAIAARVAFGTRRRDEERDAHEPMPASPLPEGSPADGLRALRTALDGSGRDPLPDAVLQQVAATYELRLPRRIEAGSVDDATVAARTVGYPVVLKTRAAGVVHKTDVGGVAVGLRADDEVAGAYRQIVASVSAHVRAPATDVVVEEMVGGGVEAFIGARTDPVFGPVIAIGLGGTLVELFRDAACVLLPARAREIEDAMGRTRLDRLFRGFRGRPRADAGAFVGLALRVGALLRDLGDPAIEVDLNPVSVLPEGQGVRVLDLRIVKRF
jgi:acyl-CoA synthetase (NDP forming)